VTYIPSRLDVHDVGTRLLSVPGQLQALLRREGGSARLDHDLLVDCAGLLDGHLEEPLRSPMVSDQNSARPLVIQSIECPSVPTQWRTRMRYASQSMSSPS
jgi:hypothetical protein